MKLLLFQVQNDNLWIIISLSIPYAQAPLPHFLRQAGQARLELQLWWRAGEATSRFDWTERWVCVSWTQAGYGWAWSNGDAELGIATIRNGKDMCRAMAEKEGGAWTYQHPNTIPLPCEKWGVFLYGGSDEDKVNWRLDRLEPFAGMILKFLGFSKSQNGTWIGVG